MIHHVQEHGARDVAGGARDHGHHNGDVDWGDGGHATESGDDLARAAVHGVSNNFVVVRGGSLREIFRGHSAVKT